MLADCALRACVRRCSYGSDAWEAGHCVLADGVLPACGAVRMGVTPVRGA